MVATAAALDTQKFWNWAIEQGKSYDSEEEILERMAYFHANDAAIDTLNSLGLTSVHGHNFLSDYSPEEYKNLLGFKANVEDFDYETVYLSEDSNSSSVDWRQHGAVTGVKNQGSCGSCWSFSSTGAMEGAHKIKSGSFSLFPSNSSLTAPDPTETRAVTVVGKMMPSNTPRELLLLLSLTTDTPEEMALASTSQEKSPLNLTPRSPSNSPSQLKAALNKQPVAVTIEADRRVFQSYHSGVLTGSSCGTSLDHAVLAVGYGKENGVEYYLVKNSWGTSWGDKGYIKIGIESGKGVCGIQQHSRYPQTN
eukprot:CAMPEP_0116875920 /NCGR_PEP_ID=MMETSP0463-20121206/8021_1 /TAXON_ID=181622 /ORGANISM="Strombidinopsis sp, Strain SopsisLIS2011" /LENGTH=307 /DNA_ID=CAMNT_0004522325 /DNA_START=53 /DNA_END=976 /DNA_ORIENTATION=-